MGERAKSSCRRASSTVRFPSGVSSSRALESRHTPGANVLRIALLACCCCHVDEMVRVQHQNGSNGGETDRIEVLVGKGRDGAGLPALGKRMGCHQGANGACGINGTIIMIIHNGWIDFVVGKGSGFRMIVGLWTLLVLIVIGGFVEMGLDPERQFIVIGVVQAARVGGFADVRGRVSHGSPLGARLE